jgi:lysophospholipase L1-like esterase
VRSRELRGWRRSVGGVPRWLLPPTVVLVLGALLLVALGSGAGSAPRAASPAPTHSAAPVTAAFVGDSYTHGTGASTAAWSWVSLVIRKEGWRGSNLGRSGTGYVKTADVWGCGLPYCPNYPAMVSVAARTKPAVLVIAGGQNDFRVFSTDRTGETKAIQDTYTKARRLLPDSVIVGVGPSTPWGVNDDVRAFAKVVTESVRAVGGRYVSMIDPDVLHGGDASLLSSDHVHPNDAGHAAIAARFLAQVPPAARLAPTPTPSF